MLKLNKKVMAGGMAAVLAAATLTGCASWRSGDGDRTAGRIVDDRRITGQVEDALRSAPVYKFSDVEVKTFNGVVQLSGFVSTDEQKNRAAQLAERVPGVQQVVNSLMLKNAAGDVSPTGRDSGNVYGTNQPMAAPIGNPNERNNRWNSNTNNLSNDDLDE